MGSEKISMSFQHMQKELLNWFKQWLHGIKLALAVYVQCFQLHLNDENSWVFLFFSFFFIFILNNYIHHMLPQACGMQSSNTILQNQLGINFSNILSLET